MTTRRRPAPVFLDLMAIRFPVGAVASIAHRVSGVLLLVALPLLARLLDQSLRSAADYDALFAGGGSFWIDGALVIVVWAAAHHLFAGLRHLLMDVGVGSALTTARASALAALVLGVLAAAAFALGLP